MEWYILLLMMDGEIRLTKVFHKNQILDLFPDIMFSGNNNATSDAVINAP